MLSLALLTAAALLVPAPVPPAQPPVPLAPLVAAASLAIPESPAPAPETPAEPLELGPNLSAARDWSPAATCTEGSLHFVNAGECCGVGLSRTLFLQEKCVNGNWVGTGLTQCHLPICEILP